MRNNKTPIREKEKEKEPLVRVSDDESSKEQSEHSDSEELPKIPLEEEEEISTNCPIRGTVMRDPVIASDGHTYEREAITEWQKNKGTSPKTREPITAEFKPNYALKEQIEHTMRIAEQKKKAEKEKEQEQRRREREKQKTSKERKRERETFKQEMRKMMEEAREERAALREQMAQMEERMGKWEEEIEYTRQQNAKLAKEFMEFRNSSLDKSSLLKGMLPGLAALGTTQLVGWGIVAGLILGGVTVASGGIVWIIIGIVGGSVVIGGLVWGAVSYHDSKQDELAYARDKTLIETALRNALNGQAEALGQMKDAGNFTLTGLVEAIAYAIAGIGNNVRDTINGWRNYPTLTAPQQVQYLEDVKTPTSTNPAVQMDDTRIKINYMYDKGQMPIAVPDGARSTAALNKIAEEGNRKLQEGDIQTRNLKGSAVYTLATTAVDAGIKAVNENKEPEFGVVYVAAIKIDQAYVTKQQDAAKANSTTQGVNV